MTQDDDVIRFLVAGLHEKRARAIVAKFFPAHLPTLFAPNSPTSSSAQSGMNLDSKSSKSAQMNLTHKPHMKGSSKCEITKHLERANVTKSTASHNRSGIAGLLDFNFFSKSNDHKRGASSSNNKTTDEEQKTSSGQRDVSNHTGFKSGSSQENWLEKKYDSLDQRLIALIELLTKNPENQSQLISDFQEYYFEQKPIMTSEQIKRLFFGYLR